MKKDKLKILLLASFFINKDGSKFGGAEKVLTCLANWLAENTQNEIILFSVEGNHKPYRISEKVIFETLGLSSNNKIFRHLQIIKNTKIALNKYKPDIIISFSIQPIFYAIILKLFSNIRFFYSERNDPKLEYGLIARIMRWFVMKKSDGIVFQTNDAMNYFAELTFNPAGGFNCIPVEYDRLWGNYIDLSKCKLQKQSKEIPYKFK